MGCGAVGGCGDEVGVVDLSGGERVGQGLIEGVAPGPGGGVESVGAIGAGQGGGRRRPEMVLAAVDVVHGEGAGGAGIAGGCVGNAAGLEDRGVLAHPGGDGGVVVGAGDGDGGVIGIGGGQGCDPGTVQDRL